MMRTKALQWTSRAARWVERRCVAAIRDGAPITLPAQGAESGSAFLAYLTDPWIDPSCTETHDHTNRWECAAMAAALTACGLRVEVVDYQRRPLRPGADCRVFIGIEGTLAEASANLPAGCARVLHAPTTHWLFNNTAEMKRLCALRERRGVALQPRRQIAPHLGVELADHVTCLGNAFTASTYAFAGKPVHRIPLSTVHEAPERPRRPHEKTRRKFLWLGGPGLVHKGLDIVLEAFAGLPDLELTIAGPLDLESDFARAYAHELARPNVRYVGWVRTRSPAFAALLREHGAIVMPSCAEGGGGSVLTCTHDGLVPIVTPETSVDVGQHGFVVPTATPEQLAGRLRAFADLSETDFDARSHAAWRHARDHHTRPGFRTAFASFLEKQLGLRPA